MDSGHHSACARAARRRPGTFDAGELGRRVAARCRRAAAVLVAAAVLLAACGSGAKHPPKRTRCVALRNHLVDLELSARRSHDLLTDKYLAQHRNNLRRALGKRFVNACVAGHSGWNVECALAVKTKAGLASCAAKTAK